MALQPIPARSVSQVVRQAEADIGKLVLIEARRDRSGSKELKFSLRVRKVRGKHLVGVPHYWARWYLEGRGRVTPKPGGALVFWTKNARVLDPRLGGRYPVTRSQTRRLTKEEFQRALAEGRATIVRYPNSAGPWRGNNFILRAVQKVSRGDFYTGVVDTNVERRLLSLVDRALNTSLAKPIRKAPPLLPKI